MAISALLIASLLSSASVAAPATQPSAFTATADFPGGAAEILSIDAATQTVRFRVPADQNGGWPTWWSIRITGIDPSKPVTLELSGISKSPATRPSFSTDGGKTWRFGAPAKAAKDKPLTYVQELGEGVTSAHFAWYVPYLPADAAALVDRIAKASPHATRIELCRSEADLPVVGLRFREGDTPDERRFNVWVQARQHAWEAGGSWVAHGLAEWLGGDDPRARDLRQRASITLIPIMDVDSVQRGRGGKEQKPHDHNRDWSATPHWKAVQAAKAQATALDDAGRLDLFIDLHDPGWSGGVEFWCHAYEEMNEHRRARTDRFVAAVQTDMTGPLKYPGKIIDRYPIDTPTAGIWACTKTRQHVVGGTFEIGVGPPAGFTGAPPEHHLTCGRQLGLGIERYLRERPR